MAWTPFTRADHDRSRLRYTSDMTDAEFERIAPLLIFGLMNTRLI